MKKHVLAAMVLSDQGVLLPHTCRYTMQACEEEASEDLAGWERMKELGARVVQVEIHTDVDLHEFSREALNRP